MSYLKVIKREEKNIRISGRTLIKSAESRGIDQSELKFPKPNFYELEVQTNAHVNFRHRRNHWRYGPMET